MEEKILIKSQTDKNVKEFLQKGPLYFFATTIFLCLFLTLNFEPTYRWHSNLESGWSYAFSFYNDTAIFCFVVFVIACLSFIAAVTIGIIYLVHRKCELCITENNVKGKTLLGKEVVLPLDKVSAYVTRKFLSTIAVATASGITKFSLIGNYAEIGEVLAQKISQRQKGTESAENRSKPQDNSTNELFQLKSYLDAGIITQEEFDQKKKQLLGL